MMFWQKSATVTLPDDPSVRRSSLSPNELLTLPAGDQVTTMGDIFSYTAKKYGDKIACSYREVIDIVEETKKVKNADGGEDEKVWKFFTLSEPIPLTHNQLDQTVSAIVSGLLHLGVTTPLTTISERPRGGIYADTSISWQLMSQSFARLGIVITTAYTTLGEDGLLTSLVEPEVECVFCGEGQIGMIERVVERAERVNWVIYDGEKRVDKAIVEKMSKVIERRGGRIIPLSEVRRMGEEIPLQPGQLGPRPQPDDLFCIMYTSGSTGTPKGVLLTHANVVSSLAGSIRLWGAGFDPKTDFFLAYLPLAHILEQFLEFTLFMLGVPIGYGTVKTLLDDSVRNCRGDFAAYSPTLIGGVPAIYEMIRKGMMKKISEAGPVVGTIFNLAVRGKQTLPWPMSAVIDRVLFAKVKQATGGRLRVAVCGGGALSKDTQLFLSTVLAPVQQGYGLTETCGMASITTPEHWRLGSAGNLGPSCELKLIDQPDLGYSTSTSPPRGEIWLRGPNIFQGYYKQPELTRKSFSEDGWFKTGDIGQWEDNGTLTIIDRVKHLVKLQNGEYLALDKVESVYKACDVTMMLCLVAPPYAECPVAVVYPHEGNLRNHLKVAGISADGVPANWVNNDEIKKYILGELRGSAKLGKLEKAEMVRDVVLTPEEWSPDNKLLTPTMKLNRAEISRRFAKEIEAAYGR